MQDTKYFAKYILRNGVIKKGDIVKIEDKGVYNPYFVCQSKVEASIYNNWKESPPIAELHLCIRKVEPDTFVIHRTGSVPRLVTRVIYEKGLLLVDKSGKGNFGASLSDYYPHNPEIIGRISPKAIWVKQFDEFTEKDVKIGSVIKIKCNNCKTWH